METHVRIKTERYISNPTNLFTYANYYLLFMELALVFEEILLQ